MDLNKKIDNKYNMSVGRVYKINFLKIKKGK